MEFTCDTRKGLVNQQDRLTSIYLRLETFARQTSFFMINIQVNNSFSPVYSQSTAFSVFILNTEILTILLPYTRLPCDLYIRCSCSATDNCW